MSIEQNENNLWCQFYLFGILKPTCSFAYTTKTVAGKHNTFRWIFVYNSYSSLNEATALSVLPILYHSFMITISRTNFVFQSLTINLYLNVDIVHVCGNQLWKDAILKESIGNSNLIVIFYCIEFRAYFLNSLHAWVYPPSLSLTVCIC